MEKPRIFLGSSGKQDKLLQALTRGLEAVAHVAGTATLSKARTGRSTCDPPVRQRLGATPGLHSQSQVVRGLRANFLFTCREYHRRPRKRHKN